MLTPDQRTVIHTNDTLKMVRETLCVAQLGLPLNDPRYEEHSRRIQRLIADIDRQRPLGPNGKHGDRHCWLADCADVDSG